MWSLASHKVQYLVSGLTDLSSNKKYAALCWSLVLTKINEHLSDFVETSPGAGRSPVSKTVGGLTSWSLQLDSPGTALKGVGGSGLGVKTSGVGRRLF